MKLGNRLLECPWGSSWEGVPEKRFECWHPTGKLIRRSGRREVRCFVAHTTRWCTRIGGGWARAHHHRRHHNRYGQQQEHALHSATSSSLEGGAHSIYTPPHLYVTLLLCQLDIPGT